MTDEQFETLDLMKINCPLCNSIEHRRERFVLGHPVARPWQLVKCQECGFVYVNPRLSERDTSIGYQGIASFSREFGAHSYVADAERLAGQISESTPHYAQTLDCIAKYGISTGRILDVGCGSGAFLKFASTRGFDVCGQDLASYAPADDPVLNSQIFVGELTATPWPNGYFDVVVNRSVLEHLWNPLREIREMCRLLRPNGILACAAIPNYASLSVRLGRSSFFVNHPPGHLNYFTPATLRRIATLAGFRVLDVNSSGLDVLELLGGNHRIVNYGGRASYEIDNMAIQQIERKPETIHHLTAKSIKASSRSRNLQRAAERLKNAKKVVKKICSLCGIGGALEIYCTRL